MNRIAQSVLLMLTAVAGAHAQAPEAWLTRNTGRTAFEQPVADLSSEERERFFHGRSLFAQSWVVAPAKDDQVDGLGPLYNRLACVSCHAKNGRGLPPEHPGERLQSMLVRLSIPGSGKHGGPNPHPAYGDQFNEEGIPGVKGEGRVEIRWSEKRTRLKDGTVVFLRRPHIAFSGLNYGALGGVLTSPRVGQQVVGMGLLDSIPEETLAAMATEPKPDGVKGCVNRVWNPATERMEAGRFGYKANMPTLLAQSAGAFLGDLGITSPLHPEENCTPRQSACRGAPSGGKPELSKAQLEDVAFYLAHLAVPVRRGSDDPIVGRGEMQFAAAGCTACHRPGLQTGSKAPFPRLANQAIAPYTDLLMHDMGAGLSDGRPDFLASGREWRTPPLWGIGLTVDVSEQGRYLHDGRARNLTEAILWHDGEASAARRRFERLNRADRDALLAFLASL